MTTVPGADGPPESSEAPEEAFVDPGGVYDDDETPGRARVRPDGESAQDDWRTDLPQEESQ